MSEQYVLQAKGLTKYFPVGRSLFSGPHRVVKAVDGIDLALRKGEILGLAGESGSGKSTTGELIVRLLEPTGGSLVLDGTDIATLSGARLRHFRKEVQMIFQDPFGTLNPRMTVGATVEEPLKIHAIGDREARLAAVEEALVRAGLRPVEKYFGRLPHELSGGERQRVAIARAIVLKPRVLVADEPVSMLDVSIRAGILNLLRKLRDEMGLTVVYVSHDLSTIRYLCDTTAIMYLGKLVEIGPTEQVMTNPSHPYTQLLLSAVPVPDPDAQRTRIEVYGELPDQINLPKGCRFAPRCPFRLSECSETPPPQVEREPGHQVACFLYPDDGERTHGQVASGPR